MFYTWDGTYYSRTKRYVIFIPDTETNATLRTGLESITKYALCPGVFQTQTGIISRESFSELMSGNNFVFADENDCVFFFF